MSCVVGEGHKDRSIAWRPEGLRQEAETVSAKALRQLLLEKRQGSQCSGTRVNRGRAPEVRSGGQGGQPREDSDCGLGVQWEPLEAAVNSDGPKKKPAGRAGNDVVTKTRGDNSWVGLCCEQQSDSGCMLKIEQTGFASGSMWT